MFESYFFDRRSLLNYRVFQILKRSQNTGPLSTHLLTKLTDLSYAQAYSANQDVFHDLGQLAAQHKMDENEPSEILKQISVDDYRFYLLSHMLPFQFFDYVFQNAQPDVHTFCEERGVSVSTLRRRVMPFRDYLVQNQLDLNSNTWELEGDELHIRLFLVAFYSLAYRGVGWPFGDELLTRVKALYQTINAQAPVFVLTHRDPVTKQDLMILALQQIRIENDHPLRSNRRMAFLFTPKTNIPDLIFTKRFFPLLSATTLTAEREYFYFSRFHFVSMNQQPDRVDELVIKKFSGADNLVGRFVDGLLEFLNARLATPVSLITPAAQVLRANLYRVAFSEYVLAGQFSQRIDFSETLADESAGGHLSALIRSYLATIPKEKPESIYTSFSNQFISDLFILLSTPFKKLNQTALLTVKVVMENDSFATRDLIQFLTDIGFVELLPADDPRKPLVIITTVSFAADMSETLDTAAFAKTIFWFPQPNEQDYFLLYQTLRSIRLAMLQDNSETSDVND